MCLKYLLIIGLAKIINTATVYIHSDCYLKFCLTDWEPRLHYHATIIKKAQQCSSKIMLRTILRRSSLVWCILHSSKTAGELAHQHLNFSLPLQLCRSKFGSSLWKSRLLEISIRLYWECKWNKKLIIFTRLLEIKKAFGWPLQKSPVIFESSSTNKLFVDANPSDTIG